MKATELRIGNWVSTQSDEIVKVGYEIIRSLIVFPDKPEYKPIPIPLTEKWLVKFGFEKRTKSIYKKKRGVEIIFDSEDKVHWYGNGTDGVTELFFVHQIQNLYFALTGTELELI